jgi:glycosyltransferase involved in cell wall biosynthesis
MPKLSILICHVPARAAMLDDLLASIHRQPGAADCEVLINASGGTTGAKRNALLSQARGEYIAFVDDDDRVAADYLPRVMGALESKPDVVGLELEMIVNGRESFRCVHSLEHRDWFERVENGRKVFYRCPNHLNPVRRELAIAAGFPDVTVGEDKAYSLELRPYLTREVMLSGPPLYLYRAGPRRDYTSTPPAIFA